MKEQQMASEYNKNMSITKYIRINMKKKWNKIKTILQPKYLEQ